MTPKAKAFDQYFTPPLLATELIDSVTVTNISRIADFAAGDGELLRAAEGRWKNIECVANDIDNDVVDKLIAKHPAWKTTCCDFTDRNTRQSDELLSTNSPKMSVIVLNPPFSCKGGASRVVSIMNISVRCSPAMAFIIEATEYLEEDGQLVAIVPHNVVQGEKDEKARTILQQYLGFEVVKLLPRGGFSKCSPRTAIIRLSLGKTQHDKSSAKDFIIDEPNVIIQCSLIRGTISNTTVKDTLVNSLPFIHTVDLQKGAIQATKKHIQYSSNSIVGPAVLLPRVGKPSVEKIVLLAPDTRCVLSDCIMALECHTIEDAKLLHARLVANWLELEHVYSGTCARFITTKGLCSFLEHIRCDVQPYGGSIRSEILPKVLDLEMVAAL